jgi:FHA domain
MNDDVLSFGGLAPEEDGDSELTADALHSSYPFLDVRKPDGNEYSLRFEDILAEQPGRLQIAIGRSSSNDIVLPDPHKKVSRSHCAIKREGDRIRFHKGDRPVLLTRFFGEAFVVEPCTNPLLGGARGGFVGCAID